MQAFLQKGKALLTPSQSSSSLSKQGKNGEFITPPTANGLFPTVPEDCIHDCDSCSVHYPAKWSIDETDNLYGFGKPWDTHLLVGTGKTDWVRDVTDEKGSVMQAVGKYGEFVQLDKNRGKGKVRLSACNMPLADGEENTSTCLLMPAWQIIERVSPGDVPTLMEEVIAKSASNKTRVTSTDISQALSNEPITNGKVGTPPAEEDNMPKIADLQIGSRNLSSKFNLRQCPHRAVILMCSHKTRDARCGISAPLLKKEFERLLRPLGLYRDMQDERPGGVGIYFINHVGGHKYSANVIIYRREGSATEDSHDWRNASMSDEAVQCIWLARVRPEDCENLVNYTVLQGKVIRPNSQLRSGYDRERGVLSW